MSQETDNTAVTDAVEQGDSAEAIEQQVEDTNAAAIEASAEDSGDIQDALSDVMEDADTVSENSETGEDGQEKEVDQQIKDLKKKLKLKVDGEEIEEEIDLNDEERLKRALQKEKAFDKRSQEWTKFQKQVGDFVNQLKGDTFGALQQMGIDVDQLVMDYAQRAVEEAEKSPEQLEREKMEQELKQLKEEREKITKEKEQAELEQLKNQQANEIQQDILTALDSTETVLPKKNPWVLRKVAETMLLAMNNGYPQVKAKDVIPLVEKQFRNDLKGMFDMFPEDVIENVVGKGNLDRIRKRRLKNRNVKTETARQSVKPTNNRPVETDTGDKPKKTYKDLFDPRF